MTMEEAMKELEEARRRMAVVSGSLDNLRHASRVLGMTILADELERLSRLLQDQIVPFSMALDDIRDRIKENA